MTLATCIRRSVVALLLVFSTAACEREAGVARQEGSGEKTPSMGRMAVAIMPEYDDPGILVIYEGKFEEAPSYPIRANFLIPKGSVVSDACSLSHEGKHFCQLYRTVNRGDFDEVTTQLPYPNFYLSFHTPRLDTATPRKEIVYRIKTSHHVRSLEVDIQQPLRSTEFGVQPPQRAAVAQPGGSASVIKGFNRVAYRLGDVAAGREDAFRIGYLKTDPHPSVDIKVAPMRESPGQAVAYDAPRDLRPILYTILGAGVIGLALLFGWRLRPGRGKRGKPS